MFFFVFYFLFFLSILIACALFFFSTFVVSISIIIISLSLICLKSFFHPNKQRRQVNSFFYSKLEHSEFRNQKGNLKNRQRILLHLFGKHTVLGFCEKWSLRSPNCEDLHFTKAIRRTKSTFFLLPLRLMTSTRLLRYNFLLTQQIHLFYNFIIVSYNDIF